MALPAAGLEPAAAASSATSMAGEPSAKQQRPTPGRSRWTANVPSQDSPRPPGNYCAWACSPRADTDHDTTDSRSRQAARAALGLIECDHVATAGTEVDAGAACTLIRAQERKEIHNNSPNVLIEGNAGMDKRWTKSIQDATLPRHISPTLEIVSTQSTDILANVAYAEKMEVSFRDAGAVVPLPLQPL